MENKKYCILDENQIKEQNGYDIGEISPFDIGIHLIDVSDETIKEIYYLKTPENLKHNKYITVLWDKNGKKYNKGAGMKVYINGVLKAQSSEITQIIL